MKVAIVCGAGIVSGKEIMALELGEGLREWGEEVVYVTSLWGNGDFSRRLSEKAFFFYRMRLGFISATLSLDCMWMTADQLVRWPKLLYDYRRFLKREKPTHVIHTNWHHILMLWPFLRPTRDLLWLHETLPDKLQYRRVFARIGKRIGRYCVVSEAVANSLRELDIRREQIQVIHNGISDPAAGVGFAPRSTGCNIGIVGQVGAWKGHEDLLQAFALTSTAQSNAILHVFGAHHGEFAARLKQSAMDLDVAERVVWHGFVADRSKVYSALDICVVPSRFEEPFGLVAIEAAFFGVPVIATRKGGLPEIVLDGGTGYLVDVQSPDQIADRLDRLLGDAELRGRMGAAARERAMRQFSRERFAEDFRSLLARKEFWLHSAGETM